MSTLKSLQFSKVFPGLLIAASGLLSIAPAMAEHACLVQVSNQELVQEVSRRMGSSGGHEEDSISVIYHSKDYYLVVNLFVNLKKIANQSIYIGNTTTAQELSVLLNQTKSNLTSRGAMFAYCRDYDLYTVSLSATAIVENRSEYIGNIEQCKTLAQTINNRVR